MITFGSLFAGIGGFDLGLERAGMKCLWQVEINDYCTKVLAKHWPDVRRYRDVRECGAHNLETVDLICGGFPCQPHSVAGKRRGKEDDRNLWPEYRRIVAELRPRWVVGENVPGIITTMLDEVLSDLEGEGYACTTLIVPAMAVNAPHRRERVFLIAYDQAHALSPDSHSIGLHRTQVHEQGWPEQGRAELRNQQECQLGSVGKDVAYAESEREAATEQQGQSCGVEQGRQAVADAHSISGQCNERWTWKSPEGSGRQWWATEPDVGRVADGVPARVDRLRALGNAVVPQVVEWIGQRIVSADDTMSDRLR